MQIDQAIILSEAIPLCGWLLYHFFQVGETWLLPCCSQVYLVEYTLVSLIPDSTVLLELVGPIRVGHTFGVMVFIMVLMTGVHETFSLVLVLALGLIFLRYAHLRCFCIVGLPFKLLLVVLLSLRLPLLNILSLLLCLRLRLGLPDWLRIHIFLLNAHP